MKIFGFILAVYVIMLSFLPCGDIKDCAEKSVDKTLFLKTEHSSPQEDVESCSPLCICACCGTNIGFNFYAPFPETETSVYFYKQNPQIAYSNDSSLSKFRANIWIWQPPRSA